jgi:hypothetical protein
VVDDVVSEDVVSDGEVSDVEDGLMSVVSGGLVLVIVWVVVVADSDAVAENVGSTKSIGACSGWPN